MPDSAQEFSAVGPASGGEDSGATSEPQVSEAANDSGESPVAQTSEGMPSQESTPKLVPEKDLNNLRSTYDKKIAEQQKAFELMQQQFQALASQKAEQDRLLFEQQITQLPVEQQGPARQQFEINAMKQQYETALQAERLKNQQFMQSVEPLARTAVIDELSKQYDTPKEILAQFKTPAQMEAAAQVYKMTLKAQVAAKRVEKKSDVFESTNKGASVTPDIIKDYRGSGKLADYLAKKRATQG